MAQRHLLLAALALAISFALAKNAAAQGLSPSSSRSDGQQNSRSTITKIPLQTEGFKTISNDRSSGKTASSGVISQKSKSPGQINKPLGQTTKEANAASNAQASPSSKTQVFEAMCRLKAKEAANQAFNSCMGESKTGEIEKVRQEYQEKLSRMKSDYEAELSKISGKNKKKNSLMNNEILNEPVDTESASMDSSSDSSSTEETEMNQNSQEDERAQESVEREAPKTKKQKPKTNFVFSEQSKAAKSRAVLFTELSDIPEPVPMDAAGSH